MRHIIPISGKDSLTTALIQMERDPSLPYEFIYNFTGADTPDIDEWLNKVEQHLGIKIERIGADLESIIYEKDMLPSAQIRFCTREAKIFPMEDYIGKDNAIIYLGIRADENRIGYKSSSKRRVITPKYPLVEAGIMLDDVWNILTEKDLMPPLFFWQSMFDIVQQRLGHNSNLIDKLSKQVFYNLFAGRSRANCYFCFFQRQYEWIWLLETYPELYIQASVIEQSTGGEGFTWVQGTSLNDMIKKKDSIKESRCKDICNYILGTQQVMMFGENIDLLNITSCGLFCGK